jgi:hypothetical protein
LGFKILAARCAQVIVAKYRRTVAGFFPASPQISMNAATVDGDAGNGRSPQGLQKARNATQSNRQARRVASGYTRRAFFHQARAFSAGVGGFWGLRTAAAMG